MARRILLADDSVTAQNMGRRILTDAGYEVVTVNNGSAALKKIAENKPDLIVLDVYMPGYGGLEVCQRVKENPETKQIPVLLTVGKLEPFKAEEARRVGADSFIIKPFEATELLTVLTRLEDKIVAQPQPQKSGRFAKALAAVEQSDKGDRFGDKETGWKNRLTIPVPHARPPVAEEVPEIPAPAVGPEIGASASRDREPIEAAKPMESHGFERPIPIGLPADITPEEIAAITAAALVFGGQTEQPSAIVEPVVAETATAKTASVEIKLEETTTVGTTIPDAVVHETVSPEAHFVAAGVSVAETSTEIQPTVPAFSQPEASQIEAGRNAEASESVEAVPEAVAGSETALAQDQQVQEIPTLEQQPASTEAPAIAASAEVVSEVHASHSTPSVSGDAEVLAAIASLAPSNGHGDSFHSASHGSNGNALAEIVSGPRWIAEPVEVGADEAKLALDQEMDQVLVARASAEAANLAAAAAASEGAVAVAELEQPVATDAIAAEVIATEVAAAPESISPAIAAETSVAESGTSESAAGEAVITVRESTNGEASATHDQPPVAEASAYAAAASAGVGLQGSGLAGSAASASGLPNVSSEQVAPVEAVSSASAVPENSAVAQVGSTPQREAELAAAWQNWKQIRESFSGPKAFATPAEVSAEPKPKPEQAAPPTAASTEAIAAPAAEVEEAETDAPETDAPEESTAIASIVDNMLAELRPKLVAEIAKKMNSDKEKKDKEKKR